jgi:hypothetical protein
VPPKIDGDDRSQVPTVAGYARTCGAGSTSEGLTGRTDALVLRAHVVSGDRGAADALRKATSALAMPGLLSPLKGFPSVAGTGEHWPRR